MIFKRFNCLNLALVAAFSFYLAGCSDEAAWTPLGVSLEEEDPAFETADLVATIWTAADTVRWKQKADLYADVCDTLVQIGVAQNGSIAITWPSIPEEQCDGSIQYPDLLVYQDGVLQGHLLHARIVQKKGTNRATEHAMRYAWSPVPKELKASSPISGTTGQWSYTDLVVYQDISCPAGWCPVYLKMELDLETDALVGASLSTKVAPPSGLKWYFLEEGEKVMIYGN
jgi:hypothetical protein